MIVIRPHDPVTYTSEFKHWANIHASEFAFKDAYLIEIDNEKGVATAYTYKRNERDSFYMEFHGDNPKPSDGEIAKNPPKTFDMKVGLKVLNGS